MKNLSEIKRLVDVDPQIAAVISDELRRQQDHIELIASENFTSQAVLDAQGSVLTNKYAEGYPGKRWYGGCEHVDRAEQLAIDRARRLFEAEHANVQPHSGSQANMAVCLTALTPGDTLMAMNLAHGGHLTHGHPKNYSGILYRIIPYGVSQKDERLDYDEIEALAVAHRPKMILAGYSAYPRQLDFPRFRHIADKVGALLWVDMAHFAGLVAAGVHPNPVPYCDFVTTTTHKTLRGPRGGLVLCKQTYAKAIDAMIFPGIQGGPLMHVIAAKAVALEEAAQSAFRDYQHQIVRNAQALAAALIRLGFRIVSGGTDNHLMLVDVSGRGWTGKQVQEYLDGVRITVNKNMIPFDQQSPFQTSGVRLGTPAVTTRGMKEPQMEKIAQLINDALEGKGQPSVEEKVRRDVLELTRQFPLQYI